RAPPQTRGTTHPAQDGRSQGGMIAPQKPGPRPAAQGGSDTSPAADPMATASAAVIRRKSARQALADRASRGLSLMSGFKSRQEKSDAPGKPARSDKGAATNGEHSMPTGDTVAAAVAADAASASAAGGTADAPQTTAAAAGDPASAVAPPGSGAGPNGYKEDYGPAGVSGHLTKLVLKFTTASESDVQPSCEITTAGASIGQSDDNTVSIPSDSMLAPLNHAIVKYEECSRRGTDHNITADGGGGGRGGGVKETVAAPAPAGPAAEQPCSGEKEGNNAKKEASAVKGGSTLVPDAGGGDVETGGAGAGRAEAVGRGRDTDGGDEGSGRAGSTMADAREREGGGEDGGFFFSDGGQETDFAAAFRIRVGEGNRDWPLTQGSHFSAGLTVFRAYRARPQDTKRQREAQSDPSPASLDAAASASGGAPAESVAAEGVAAVAPRLPDVDGAESPGRSSSKEAGSVDAVSTAVANGGGGGGGGATTSSREETTDRAASCGGGDGGDGGGGGD
ncbi:unnamed protein product, partial [Scytosiphon promiscuus]